ncbi:unnamed protein product [Peniophora sp. CBMAI 1063]|nr:unnamed protein product [Peniophora sp. CBMAI 1063]
MAALPVDRDISLGGEQGPWLGRGGRPRQEAQGRAAASLAPNLHLPSVIAIPALSTQRSVPVSKSVVEVQVMLESHDQDANGTILCPPSPKQKFCSALYGLGLADPRVGALKFDMDLGTL